MENVEVIVEDKNIINAVTEKIINVVVEGGRGPAGAQGEDGQSPELLSITYSELMTLIENSSLIPTNNYLLTDFKTIHYMMDDTTTLLTDVNTCPIEPIIITAITTNTIDNVVKSTLHPTDIIHYDWNPSKYLDDTSFSNVQTEGIENSQIITGWKGVIIYREDTIKNNITHYDFRNVKFRRWAINPDIYNPSTNYALGAFVISEGIVYKSKSNSNIGHDVNDTNWWIYVIELIDGKYLSWSSNNLLNIPVDAVDYIDYYTFAFMYDILYANNYIGKNYYIYSEDYNGIHRTLLNNIVFIDSGSNPDGYILGVRNNNNVINDLSFNNTIGSNFSSNTIGSSFSYNTIGSGFSNNTIGLSFSSNTIGSYFYNNTIGSSFYNNTIGLSFYNNTIRSYFSNNTIGSGFSYNTIGLSFSSNTIGSGFSYNTIGSYFSSNTIGSGFSYNTIGSYFYNNTIGSSFYNNTIGLSFSSNTIRSNFYNNTIGSSFKNNTIGSSFINNIIYNNLIYIIAGNNFQKNTIYDGVSGLGNNKLNFTTATHVYTTYNKEIFRRQDGTIRLRYTNNSDVLVIVSATS